MSDASHAFTGWCHTSIDLTPTLTSERLSLLAAVIPLASRFRSAGPERLATADQKKDTAAVWQVLLLSAGRAMPNVASHADGVRNSCSFLKDNNSWRS